MEREKVLEWTVKLVDCALGV